MAARDCCHDRGQERSRTDSAMQRNTLPRSVHVWGNDLEPVSSAKKMSDRPGPPKGRSRLIGSFGVELQPARHPGDLRGPTLVPRRHARLPV